MPVTPYFYTEALRQRFQRNLNIARAENRISARTSGYLHHLSETERPVLDGPVSCKALRLVLDDGSPESFGMVTALVIECRIGDVETLYLDTLADGLLRFTDRRQLDSYVMAAFSVVADQNPAFELQVVDGPLFEPRMWQVIDHQAQTLRRLAADLQQLPSLTQVLGRWLAATFGTPWANGNLNLQAPLVQIVGRGGAQHGAEEEHPVRLQNLEQLALDVLTRQVLPVGPRRRLIGLDGQALDTFGTTGLNLHLADLEADYHHLIDQYWNDPDAGGFTRRQRFAQALADVFSHQVWLLQQAAASSVSVLARLAATPLHKRAPVTLSRLSLTVGRQGPYKLHSLYLIHLEQGAYALYSPRKGVRHLKDRQALDYLADSPAGRKELRGYLSLYDQDELPAADTGFSLQVKDYPVDKPLFYDCIDAIIALQTRSLTAALRRHRREHGELRAMLDDALDVRALLDPRLPWIGGGGRWLSEPTDFQASWPCESPSEPRSGSSAGSVPTTASEWARQLRRIENTLRDIGDRRPVIEVLARRALSPYLAALGYPAPHEGQDIRLTWNEQGVCADGDERVHCESPRSHGLTDLVLERLSGARARRIPPDSRVRLPAEHQRAAGMGPLTASVLDTVVSRGAAALLASCTASFKKFYDRPLRSAGTQHQVTQTLRDTREQLLRLELVVARRMDVIPAALLDLLQGMLDCPLSTLRRNRVEALALNVRLNGRRFSLGLDVAWALRAPDQSQQSLLFWSPLVGLKAMDCAAPLQTWLQARLTDPDWRSRWLAIFPGEVRQWLDDSLAADATITVSLERVEGDFLRCMQLHGQQWLSTEFAAALRDARRQRLAAEPFKSLVDLNATPDWLLTWLDHLSIRVQNLLLIGAMPDWLQSASLDDLQLYVDLVQAYVRDHDPATDFLADVPTIRLFARERLREALRRDFSGHDPDPDTITLTMTRYAIAPVGTGDIPMSVPAATIKRSESLVDYALNHFSHMQDGVSSVSLSDGAPAPAGLDARYVARLVHELDVGLQYQRLLAERFDPGKPEYAQHRERFMRNVPWRLLVTAMEMKMQGVISQAGFDYIEAVLDMPDGLARRPVNGRQIVLRPLALLPRKGMAADAVGGFFLIGPKDPTQGPLVLHVHFSEAFSFSEFRDHQHLLARLRVAGPLQDLLLSRVEPRRYDRYANGGLNQAHIVLPAQSSDAVFDTTLERAEKVSLDTSVIEGNALLHLFEAFVQLMHRLSRTQAVTSAEADRARFTHLTGLLAEQLLSFTPGKLGLLVSLWQSASLMQHSVSAAMARRWGEAIGDFSVALGTLVSTRRGEIEPRRSRFQSWMSIFSRRRTELPADLRLHAFEVVDIELSALHYDAANTLYRDPLTQTYYAAVQGKVYQVRKVEGVWRINGTDRLGPRLRRDQEQQWQLDLEQELRSGPGSSSPYDRELDDVARAFMTVRAEGMKNIRLYSLDEARKINMARYAALGYLKNALFNLNAPTANGLSAPVQKVLKDFFGVEASPSIIDGVRQRLTEVFVGLSESSLGPLGSGRFVLGTSKRGHESTSAFVVVNDPHKRIFLSDLFFSPPDYPLKDASTGSRAFNLEDYYRASILIHEMSHQACGAVDFAYLEAGAPPVEMIDDRLPVWQFYKARLKLMRQGALSHLTPGKFLFRIPGDHGMRDLGPGDVRLFARLTGLTGQPTLDEARKAFLEDPQVRSRVILGNADSIAMLAGLLGLQRFN
ncbi:hypothetical protein EGJ27_17480 [Pseudomonas sp. v388]|uniref:dermonecrotic toxin domain-containing protein n=1 Tax=Pseudomonas sp. v388 TaxID=2479849 RepID=UPI000F7AF72A|nr:DUF6543 domain-containing protein [Pseudomonas sp. v388]RRV05606.1 hypothetical protein EGJ27_17480 [Pseudomonas sp. v388]